jgi:hypothetical protein
LCWDENGEIDGPRLSDKVVIRLDKQIADAAVLDPTLYSGYSLRSGSATATGDAGVGLADLMRQTRNKSSQIPLSCLRPADHWRNDVAENLFAWGD